MKMNFSRKFGSGFTLIELLVVVSIIAVLSSIVLVSIGNARGKGADASVKANLNTVRGLSELFYANNGNSFLPSGGATLTIQTCPAYNASGTNMFAKDININSAIVEAVRNGASGSSCYNAVSTWAVAVGLKTAANTSWCIDAGGISKKEAFAASSAIDPVTFRCK